VALPIAERLGVDLVAPAELSDAAAAYGAPLPASLVP
ncbi:MAG: hypothetical protein QOD81_4084, partial [Solirubrobacteraceae bacterium]|nr:hypothetical protein [Solirubrobacteraceae bacterium]